MRAPCEAQYESRSDRRPRRAPVRQDRSCQIFAKREVPRRAGYIEADLGAESFGVGPLDLWPEAVEEREADGRGLCQVDGVEVEDVGLDGEVGRAGNVAEGGPGAHVGDGFEGLAV